MCPRKIYKKKEIKNETIFNKWTSRQRKNGNSQRMYFRNPCTLSILINHCLSNHNCSAILCAYLFTLRHKASRYWQAKICCIIITRVSSINRRITFLLPSRQLPFFGRYIQVQYAVIFLRKDMEGYKSSAMLMVKGKKDDSISKNLSNEALLNSYSKNTYAQ